MNGRRGCRRLCGGNDFTTLIGSESGLGLELGLELGQGQGAGFDQVQLIRTGVALVKVHGARAEDNTWSALGWGRGQS